MSRWKTDNIYAHRGYHDKPTVPENSMAAFTSTIERGWGAEFDVHLLRDGTLAVFHDSSLKRCAGVDGEIEDLTLYELKKLNLEGTQEKIPTFEEVLKLFEKSKAKNGMPCPLIIELKSERGNHKALTDKVCEALRDYKGDFVIESFDPRVLLRLKKIRPDIIRGQLSQDFTGFKTMSFIMRHMLTDMWLNIFTKPDFIAYCHEHRSNAAVRRAVDKKGICEASWTLRTKKDFDDAIANHCVPIFEGFDPEK